MAHQEQRDFCEGVRARFSEFFHNTRVLDCGSLDINGSNRDLFSDSEYLGVDIGPGRNVDLVSLTHELTLPERSFDVIVSTECFEHDRHYVESLRKICSLLRPGGLFFFSCAGIGRPEHGTLRTHAGDSPFTAAEPGWENYYKNLDERDVRAALDVDAIFSEYEFSRNQVRQDLYFWGIKKGEARLRVVGSVSLAVPTYCRYDLLDELLLSAEAGSVRPKSYIIIDNGNAYSRARLNSLLGERSSVAELIAPGRNIGVAASWNRILDMTRGETVVISNDDVVLGEHTFRDLVRASERSPFVGDGWFLFAQTPECTERVGYYDENFWPGYYEDSDYQVRLHKAGITRLERSAAPYVHHQSATTGQLGEDWIREHRERNRLYFLEKWNGLVHGQDPIHLFGEPFNGSPPPGWRLRSPISESRRQGSPRTRKHMTRIFDCFMFHNELDILQCRLEELSPVVDRFVVVECGETHMGDKKQSNYLRAIERFRPWADQIEYVWVPTLQNSDPKLREHEHREWVRFGLERCRAEPDDIVIHSDVDEILTAASLASVTELENKIESAPNRIIAFDQEPRYFAVDWLHPRRCPIAPAARRFRDIGSFWGMRQDSVEAPCIPNAGWHFSWLGNSEAHLSKIDSLYEGPELVHLRPHLIAGNNRRLGIFVDGVQMAPVEIDDTFPAFIREGRCPPSWFRPRTET